MEFDWSWLSNATDEELDFEERLLAEIDANGDNILQQARKEVAARQHLRQSLESIPEEVAGPIPAIATLSSEYCNQCHSSIWRVDPDNLYCYVCKRWNSHEH